ncbi:FHA domain-containing protein [Streptomyces spectabilis]|uniref:FHA domain-containing protein n=1 Tax=Streptomyces spectabilis TaxID=68270 RepID=A0A516R8B1_STRST|nr:FHA domain-containing protein [Streptomyces spectabilis]QDQ11864.1 FHA domain-containing protein [Streptomyces spectabilis]
MQIRLTVLGPRGGQTEPGGRPAAACDVLVTAPAGTALAAVASGLAAAVAAGEGPAVLYAESERLDLQRCTLGEPPLVDGAVLCVGAPAEPGPELADAAAQLHVVAGPDAGGVHLLHGGQIRVGRSAQADVPLDDPDVSRLHCAVTLDPDGRVTVEDLGSTNGTAVDGRALTDRPVRLASGSLLRIGESVLRLTTGSGMGGVLDTASDGEGHVRVRVAGEGAADGATVAGTGAVGGAWGARAAEGSGAPGFPAAPGAHAAPGSPGSPVPPASYDSPARPAASGDGVTQHAYGTAEWGASGGSGDGARGVAESPVVPRQGGAPEAERSRTGTPARGTPLPRGLRKRGGLSAWARRLAGGRGDETAREHGAYDEVHDGPEGPGAYEDRGDGTPPPEPVPEVWPDAAALLLTALGPGTRLWERGPGHPEALAVRLGTVDRAAPGQSALLPAVPVTVSLRETGALGLAGPRERLAGLARSVLAQLAALHAPTDLEIVLISTDRARTPGERAAEWAWLGWLPHLRPAHGQDCRLLLAYDREQASARTAELLRRLDEPETAAAGPGEARPQEARGPAVSGPRTVVVVDGDPGSAALREAAVRLARDGGRAGIHVVCLAETATASPASPVAETYEAACSVSPAFRSCGAVALLSGDVATALRVLRAADGQPAGHGTVAVVDAVSAAWAQRFARALAPLRPDGTGGGHARVATPLPQAARLLDELGLARATPASLMARWAAAGDDAGALGGRAWAVLGAGARGPVVVDLAADGPHLLVAGPPGSGRTELLRSVAASLAAAERPDRLGIVLVDGGVDGRDGGAAGGTGGGQRPGEGLRACTDLPHVGTHLAANDPVRMREFAQSLTAELKRRAELLGRQGFAEWHTGRAVAGRIVAPRGAPDAEAGGAAGAGDTEVPSSATLRLRPPGAGARPDPGPPLARLVVVVDDYDSLLAPALGSPGRPAAGSVVRALDAVARDGERLGVHLVAAVRGAERVAETEVGRRAGLRVTLDAPGGEAEDAAPGRGVLGGADGRTTAFQAGRVTGRIPRTATLRPTVVPLEWDRMGDPPTRRPVRELGNGPTDLALLASALDRAAREVSADQVPSLL